MMEGLQQEACLSTSFKYLLNNYKQADLSYASHARRELICEGGLQFRMIPVLADGNCFFHTLSLFFHGPYD